MDKKERKIVPDLSKIITDSRNIQNPFQCSQCGNCCRKLRSTLNERIKQIKSTIFMMTEPNGVTLFPWERKKILKLAKEKHVEINIVPSVGRFNKYNKIIVVEMYLIKGESCPFSNSLNQCDIYNKRPQYCKEYPIVASGIFGEKIRLHNCSQKFPEMPEHIFITETFKLLLSLWGKIYEEAIKFDLMGIIIHNLLTQSNKSLVWERVLPKFRNEIDKFKKIDMIDYLVKEGITTKQEILKEIQNIKDMNVAKIIESGYYFTVKKPPTMEGVVKLF